MIIKSQSNRIGSTSIDQFFYQIRIGDENVKDTLEIPLELGLRKRAGIDGWFFGRTLNAFYIKFVKP